ncbi:hypothetical protein E2C01_005811 [Portunus trituberculatus]|uniref:Uncharacterized protein n=1 Tax=Portunus trituberculatus TaxID=210409 RepID=A0A5B7CW07_PORTR|nr:hypothetical protein [Portunus trituberculatus]
MVVIVVLISTCNRNDGCDGPVHRIRCTLLPLLEHDTKRLAPSKTDCCWTVGMISRLSSAVG